MHRLKTMRKFQIKASSWVIYILSFFIITIIGSYFVYKLFPDIIKVGFWAIFIVLVAISTLVIKKFGIAKTIWSISDKEIHLTWVSQFLFSKRPNLTISWDDIHGYNIQHERSFDRFKLVLKNGTIIRLWHDNLITKDDFEVFIKSFLKKVEEHNKQELLNSSNK